MRKILIVVMVSTFLVNASGQSYAWEDNRYLDSNKLLNKLSNKPIKIQRLSDFKLNLNVSKKVREKILALLDYRWSIEDYEIYIQSYKSKIDYRSSFIEYAKFIYPKNNIAYLKCYDSLNFDLDMKIRIDMIKSNFLKVDDNVLLLNAYLDFVEADSLYSKYFNDSIYYNKSTLLLCMARRGNVNLQTEIIKNCNYIPSQNERDWLNNYNVFGAQLIFLATQESIYKLHTWLEVNNNYTNPLQKHSRNVNQYNLVAHLISIIKNEEFRNEVSKYINTQDLPEDWRNLEVIDFTKQWLIKNKGKYLINRHFYPF